MAPFFSIGVTTYKRRELLKQTLASIAEQSCTDFEVIVGNDYTEERLSGELLGVVDARIRFINHPENLGEARNMNALLWMARGRYFTWLADDDLYVPDFLRTVHGVLVRCGFPPCVFTSYAMGPEYSAGAEKTPLEEARVLTGRQFLREYLARSLRTLGCYGVFDSQYLRGIGGIEQLGNGFSPYSDNLLAIRCGLLEKVAYIDAPLIFFRAHEGSISLTSTDLHAYASAQEELCRKSVVILRGEAVREDFSSNVFQLLRWCVRDFAVVVRRSGAVSVKEGARYVRFLRRHLRLLKGTPLYWSAVGFVAKAMVGTLIGLGRRRRTGKTEVTAGGGRLWR